MKLFHSYLSSPQLIQWPFSETLPLIFKLTTATPHQASTKLGGEDTDQGTSRTLAQSKKNLKEDNEARDQITVTADSLPFPNLTFTVPPHLPPTPPAHQSDRLPGYLVEGKGHEWSS